MSVLPENSRYFRSWVTAAPLAPGSCAYAPWYLFNWLRSRPHVSGYFRIRNFFFPDTATVHTYPANPTANPEKIKSIKFQKRKGAKDCLPPGVDWVIWVSGRVTFDRWSNETFEQSVSMAKNGKVFRDCRRFIRPLRRFDAKRRPRMEKLTIVRALPGISRRQSLRAWFQ